MKYDNIKASIVIQDGQIIINAMLNGDNKIVDENMQLVILRDMAAEALRSFEHNFQQQFRPNENTTYKLPKDDEQ